jgi:deoxyhypusine synthase
LFYTNATKKAILDLDLRRLNTMAVKAENTGMIILGGGLIKHHICNANLMVRFPVDQFTHSNYSVFSEMEQTFLFSSTRLVSLTVPTVVLSLTKPSLGGKLKRMLNLSR